MKSLRTREFKRLSVVFFACAVQGCGLDVALTRGPDLSRAANDAGQSADGGVGLEEDAGVGPGHDAGVGLGHDAGVGLGHDAGTQPSPADAGCAPGAPTATDVAPTSVSFPIMVSGQTTWVHDEQKSAGYFHTYDALVPKAGAEAHKIHVFLPRSYAGGGCKRYPVVYLNDGNTSFWPGGPANKTWAVAEVLADAYRRGSVREVIVVAVEPVERNREYTHTPWLPGEACCGASTYAAFLADGLVPFVDAAYRTKKGRADTFVAGSSHGGLSAFYVAALRSDVFGGAIAMSSSFWAGQDTTTSVGGPLSSSALMAQVGAKLATSSRPRLYLDWGLVRTGGLHNTLIEERATARGREMAAVLTAVPYGYAQGRDLFTVEDPLGEHDETSWGRRLGAALGQIVGP